MMTPPFSISASPDFTRNSSLRNITSCYQTVVQFQVQSGVMRFFAILLGLVLAASLFGQPEPKLAQKTKTDDKEPVTQSLPLLPVPPLVVSAETRRLTFQLSPLSSKGLLSQQSRDALKALMQSGRGASIVR